MLIYIRTFNFLSANTDLSQISWFQRTAGTIQSLGCYIPMLFVASALLLPLATWNTLATPSDKVSVFAISSLKWLFSLAYVSQKVNLYLVYGYCGLSTVRTLKATSIWISPCKMNENTRTHAQAFLLLLQVRLLVRSADVTLR